MSLTPPIVVSREKTGPMWSCSKPWLCLLASTFLTVLMSSRGVVVMAEDMNMNHGGSSMSDDDVDDATLERYFSHSKFFPAPSNETWQDDELYMIVLNPNATTLDNFQDRVDALAEMVVADVMNRTNLTMEELHLPFNVTQIIPLALLGFVARVHDMASMYGQGGIARRRRRQALILRTLLESDLVDFVEENQIVRYEMDQNFPPSWGLDRLDQNTTKLDNNYHYDQTGAGVTAYILDTGVRSTHDDFDGRVTCGFTAFPAEGCEDGNGHGTHVAGTVGGRTYGVAKNVSIVTVKVLNNEGTGDNFGIIEGIEYVIRDNREKGGPAVANLSLGGFRSPALNLAVSAGTGLGDAFFAVAAGNDNLDACLFSPASTRLITTVAATDKNDQRASFSNFGDCVHIFAPGVDITSAWYSSDTAKNTISGTSMASPHVAGVAALILEVEPELTSEPNTLRDRIVANGLVGVVKDPMESPNVLLNTEALFNSVAVPPPSSNAGDRNGMSSSMIFQLISMSAITASISFVLA